MDALLGLVAEQLRDGGCFLGMQQPGDGSGGGLNDSQQPAGDGLEKGQQPRGNGGLKEGQQPHGNGGLKEGQQPGGDDCPPEGHQQQQQQQRQLEMEDSWVLELDSSTDAKFSRHLVIRWVDNSRWQSAVPAAIALQHVRSQCTSESPHASEPILITDVCCRLACRAAGCWAPPLPATPTSAHLCTSCALLPGSAGGKTPAARCSWSARCEFWQAVVGVLGMLVDWACCIVCQGWRQL